MKNLTVCFCFLFSSSIFYAQQNVNYEDVAVIVNTNSPISMTIGAYFAEKRAIPAVNIIEISASIEEEVDSFEFESIRVQIETYLIDQNLTEEINYLVTTKGVPLKIEGHVDNTGICNSCASVDSELSLLFGDNQDEIGQSSSVRNAYFQAANSFSATEYGMYLVTRLDAYTTRRCAPID